MYESFVGFDKLWHELLAYSGVDASAEAISLVPIWWFSQQK